MRLIADRIAVNGRFSMRVRAVDDGGEPLPYSDTIKDLDARARERMVRDIVRELGVSPESTRAAVQQLHLDVLRAERDAAAVPPPAPSLPRICADDQLRDIEAACWAVLAAANEREGVRYAWRGDATYQILGDRESARTRLLTLDALRAALVQRADVVSVMGAPRRPPRDALADMLATVEPPLPPLRGVVPSPLVLPDGGIVMAPGYHPASGWYVTARLAIPPVSQAPTDGELARAREIIEDVIGEMPWDRPASRDNAVGAMLTRLLRPLIDGPTPLHMIEAPMPGTGKGLLADVIGLVTTGALPRLITEGRDEEEWRKRLTATLIDGAPVTLIDNLRRTLDSGQVSAALTAREWTDRYLSRSRMVTMPVTTLWLATANNPRLSEEMARRSPSIRLDPGVEHAWLRTGWRHPDLRRYALERRGDVLWSLLTMWRAWRAAASPPELVTLGSYEEWSRIVGGTLAVAGYRAHLANRERVYIAAERWLAEWRPLVDGWWRTWHGEPVGVAQLHALAVERELLSSLRAGRKEHAARTRMGNALRDDLRGRVIGLVDGLRVQISAAGEDRTGAQRYRLVSAPDPGSTSATSAPLHAAESEPAEVADVAELIPAPFADLPTHPDPPPTVILHLGDYDPSGESIFSALAEDVRAFVLADRLYAGIDVDFRRVALTADQVRDFHLPTAPAKASDSRASRWGARATCQLEALAPDQIATLVEDAIVGLIDLDILDADLESERWERQQIAYALPAGGADGAEPAGDGLEEP